MKLIRKNNKKGFTLVELIVVIAILAILALILIPAISGYTDRADRSSLEASTRALYTKAVLYDADKDSMVTETSKNDLGEALNTQSGKFTVNIVKADAKDEETWFSVKYTDSPKNAKFIANVSKNGAINVTTTP